MKKFVVIIFTFLVSGLSAQLNHPKASPFSRTSQDIGLASIKVDYSRPAVRGRKIFGELVPYGRIWRVGANESTKFTVSSNVEIMGNMLPKGTYALYAFPYEDMWEVVFHSNIDHWGDGRKAYDQEEDMFRIKITPEKTQSFQENFLIAFDSITHNSANMLWLWEHTKVVVPILVNTDSLMQKEIVKQIEQNPTAQTYYEAARYLQEQKKELATALEYLNIALEIGGDTYYFHRVKSLVEADLGNYKAAIQSAKKSLKLASAEDKDEFVRMNQKNISTWKKLVD